MRCDATKPICQPTVEAGDVGQVVVSDKIASLGDPPVWGPALASRSVTYRKCPNIMLVRRRELASAVIQTLAHAAQG